MSLKEFFSYAQNRPGRQQLEKEKEKLNPKSKQTKKEPM